MFRLYRTYKGLRSENLLLKAEIEVLRSRISNPEAFVETIIGRGIEWYDYSKLEQAALSNYHGDAHRIVRSEVFNNELSRYIADLVKFCAYDAKPEQLYAVRASIVALESFRHRLESVQNPDKQKTPTDTFSPI